MKNNKNMVYLKGIKKPGNIITIFAVIYVLMVIISVIRRISMLKEISTTAITFISIFKEFWFPFVIVALLIMTIFAYMKKEIYGVVIELAIGISMLLNVVVSVIVVGFNIGALLGTLIIPTAILIHSISVYIKIKKQKPE